MSQKTALKECPKCKSKIKRQWEVCPICGEPQPKF